MISAGLILTVLPIRNGSQGDDELVLPIICSGKAMKEIRTNYSSGYSYEQEYGYSRAVRVGNMIFISGTTARDTALNGDAYVQAKDVIGIIEATLKNAGARITDVVRTTAYIIDMADSELLARAHREAFGDSKPASTMVQVVSLSPSSSRIEIEATAVVVV
jgi:enamine deaminase RidA (YjgF/YER057c/UK114 family)